MKPIPSKPIRRARRGAVPVLAAAIVVAAVAGVPGHARAEMSTQQIKQTIERQLGVTVLKVRPAPAIGADVLAVTVMNPAGNFNEAFQVNTLAVNADTGALVMLDEPTATGFREAAPPVSERTSPLTALNR